MLSACNAEEREAKAELARLGRGIDELRAAKNEFKEVHLKALLEQPCQHHCATQRICVAAYQTHIQALHHLKNARELALNSKAEDARALQLLTQAEQELKAARPQMQDCTRIQNDAKRASGVR